MDSIHSKAIRLLEGGIVQVDTHWVRAVSLFYESDSCEACSMDCACSAEMSALCSEIDCISGKPHILKFAYE